MLLFMLYVQALYSNCTIKTLFSRNIKFYNMRRLTEYAFLYIFNIPWLDFAENSIKVFYTNTTVLYFYYKDHILYWI